MQINKLSVLCFTMLFSFVFAGQNLSGDYVNIKFYDAYKNNHSAIKSAIEVVSCNEYVSLKIENNNLNKLSYNLAGDFHSGTGSGFPMVKEAGKQIWINKEYNRSIEIKKLDKNTILVVLDGKGKEKYVYLPNGFNTFINDVLIGTYHEKNKPSKKYVFTPDGKILSNNKLVGTYEVIMDSVFNSQGIDSFTLETTGNVKNFKASSSTADFDDGKVWSRYSFDVTKEGLRLYSSNIEGETILPPNEKPLLELIRK